MKVDQKFWENTKIAKTLHLFPGLMGEMLKETTPAEVLRTQSFLPHIFFRWYFLENEVEGHRPPYLTLEYRRKYEKWPAGGQFFPKPSLETGGETVKIDIEVDYINFSEQPFFVDLAGDYKGEKAVYAYDKKYLEDIKKMNKKVTEKSFTDLKSVAVLYIEYNLDTWREGNPFIRKSFKRNEWINFWKVVFEKAGQKEGLGTDVILDGYINSTRKFFPGFGIANEELKDFNPKEIRSEEEKMHAYESYIFWLNFSYYLLLPFSLYLHLLAPVFVDKENFEADIDDLLKNYYEEPMPIYSPCTALYLTNFGSKIF